AASEQKEPVRFGHRLKEPTHPGRVDQLEDRLEHGLTPMESALLWRDEATLGPREVEGVRLHGLLELEIAVRVRQREPPPRDRRLQAGHLPEPALARCDPDRRHRRPGRDMEAGLESIDVRIDEPSALGDGYRESLVAILH